LLPHFLHILIFYRTADVLLGAVYRRLCPEEVKGAAREAVKPRHCQNVAVRQLAEHPVKLAPVGPRARYLLAVDFAAAAPGGTKLVELAVEGWC
jgi:hypothetical protein